MLQTLKTRRNLWLVVATLIVLSTACGPLPQDPLLRSLERKAGLIVYVGGDGNIHTMDQGGGNQKQITTDAGRDGSVFHTYQYPTWSPDSRKIAYVKVTGSSAGIESSHVLTAAPDGQDVVEAYTSDQETPIYLYWSPDSQRVTFLTANGPNGSLSLQMISTLGGESQLLDVGAPYYWSWSPDSQNMLVHVGDSIQSRPRLSFLNVAGQVAEELLALEPSLFQAPDWSPSGEELLLAAATDEGNSALMLTDPHGAVKSILKLLDGNVAFGWSPDGRHVAYIASERELPITIGPVAIVDPNDPAQPKVSPEDNALGFFWSPDGKKVVYFTVVVFRPTPEPNQSTPSESITLLEVYTLDAESGQSHQVTTLLPTDDFLNMMRYFDQYQKSVTVWSPDSRNLVLSGYPLGGETQALGVWVIAASGNLEPRFLVEGTLAFWSWN
jgi:Tol biopolymer transport system component